MMWRKGSGRAVQRSEETTGLTAKISLTVCGILSAWSAKLFNDVSGRQISSSKMTICHFFAKASGRWNARAVFQATMIAPVLNHFSTRAPGLNLLNSCELMLNHFATFCHISYHSSRRGCKCNCLFPPLFLSVHSINAPMWWQ